jgi:hypothetical protein
MEWITTKQIQSTDGKTEKIYCELMLDFPTSVWNKNEKSPVIQLFYYNYKVDGGWWLDKNETEWYTHPPHKFCEIQFNYFQRMPKITLYSREEKTPYSEFTLDFCKKEALKIFTERLSKVLNQCGGKN